MQGHSCRTKQNFLFFFFSEISKFIIYHHIYFRTSECWHFVLQLFFVCLSGFVWFWLVGFCCCCCFFLSYLSCSLADRRGTTVDFTTSFLHSSRFSAFLSMIFQSGPVHSLMLSSNRFLCLPLGLPPWTVPCRIVLASPDDCGGGGGGRGVGASYFCSYQERRLKKKVWSFAIKPYYRGWQMII